MRKCEKYQFKINNKNSNARGPDCISSDVHRLLRARLRETDSLRKLFAIILTEKAPKQFKRKYFATFTLILYGVFYLHMTRCWTEP